nr:ATP-binding protein [Marivibrio halodurans]
MAGRLAESFQEVTAARTDLERQVRDRTAELGRFKSTLDQTRDCVFMFDAAHLRFFYVNEGAVLHIGYDRDALIGMNAHAIDPGMSRAGFEALVTPLIRGEQPWLLFETHHRHRQGRLIPVEVFLQYVRDDGAGSAAGAEGRFVAIVRDLSERRRVERMQSEFISTVSHELRTPVAALVGALKLLESGALKDKPAKADHLVRLANRNGERLHALVNDLLDLEKLTAGKMRFAFQVHALDALLSQAVESAQTLGAERGITIETENTVPGIRLLVDAGRFDQVLGNLLSNAVKFSPPEGRVLITARETGHMIRISVSDQGAGIPEAFHTRIFEKFAQADSSNRRRTSGTGLGLAISRDIVERMGGGIGFQTEEDVGSTFFFDLPIWGTAVTDVPLAAPDGPARGPILLVAEESGHAARITQELDAAEQETIWVTSAVDALAELLRNPDIRAMVLDIDVPDANWPDLLAIFGEHRTARAPDLIPFALDPERPDSLMLIPEPWLRCIADPPRPEDLGAILRHVPVDETAAPVRTLMVSATPETNDAWPERLRALGPVETKTSIDAAEKELAGEEPVDGPFDIVVTPLSVGNENALALLDRLRASPPRIGCFLAVGKRDEATIRETMRGRLMTGGHDVSALVAALAGERSNERTPDRQRAHEPDREADRSGEREKGISR